MKNSKKRQYSSDPIPVSDLYQQFKEKCKKDNENQLKNMALEKSKI